VISGILPVDKPAGWTSHDVVARIRRLAGQKAVGHAGTLDPLATGVLLVALGNATKLSSYLMESSKAYLACVVLGATTVTDDAEAPLERSASIAHISRADIDRCLATFVGDLDQVPPRYAAVRHGGQKLYQLARKGVEVQPEPRRIHIERIDPLSWRPPRLTVRVTCGAGTYIRSLARDIGARLGVGGYLHALRRTASGSFSVDGCVPLHALQSRDDVLTALAPPDRALLGWPAAVLDDADVERVQHGMALSFDVAAQGNLRVYDAEGRLMALAGTAGGVLRPFRVFGGGDPG
jgi:tRNA pseudouridine55 synthase